VAAEDLWELDSHGLLEIRYGREDIDFTPGELLGCVSGEFGLRQFVEGPGHNLIVTSDKEGPDSVLDRELPEARDRDLAALLARLPDRGADRKGA
jgi:hypothetical protein